MTFAEVGRVSAFKWEVVEVSQVFESLYPMRPCTEETRHVRRNTKRQWWRVLWWLKAINRDPVELVGRIEARSFLLGGVRYGVAVRLMKLDLFPPVHVKCLGGARPPSTGWYR